MGDEFERRKKAAKNDIKVFEVNHGVLGDDPGSLMFFNFQNRLHFQNIPWLKNYGIQPYLASEVIFYPSCTAEFTGPASYILAHTRLTLGWGLAFKLSPQISLLFQVSSINLNRQKGDLSRELGFNINIGFY